MNRIDDIRYVRKLIEMIDSGLLTSEYYIPWSDDNILDIAEPHEWLFTLSLSKSVGEITSSMFKFIREWFNYYDSSGEPRSYDFGNIGDYRIACIFCKYRLGMISWEGFLRTSGMYSDGAYSVSVSCEYFYYKLNVYQDAYKREDVELKQVMEVSELFEKDISEVIDDMSEFGIILKDI